MKILKRILLGLAALIVLILVIVFFILNSVKKAALPDYSKDIEMAGIQSEVEILRDQYAIPHITASNEADLYKTIGFVMAQDRLWQMDLLRRVTQGRLAEILKPELAGTDLLMRSLLIQEKSEKILSGSSPEIVEALKNFAEGVNFYIEKYPLPPEFKILGYKPERWEPVHSINLIGYMSWDLKSGWDTELLLAQLATVLPENQFAELIPDKAKHHTAIFPGFKMPEINPDHLLLAESSNLEEMGIGVFEGSNNWAVSAQKSKTGKPILANDMHLGLLHPEFGIRCIKRLRAD